MFHPRNDIESAPRAIEAFKLACRAARQPLQEDKQVLIAATIQFDGLLFDFPNKLLGYPAAKQLRLVFKIGTALGHAESDTLSRITPGPARDAATAMMAAQNELNDGAAPSSVLTRSALESITSSLAYAIIALVHLRSRIPHIRACWTHLESDHSAVTLSKEATSCLKQFYGLFLAVEDLWYPMENLFEKSPDRLLTTDASGAHGFGGYSTDLYFCNPLRPRWNLHMGKLPPHVSTAWLELGALFIALHCSPAYWRNRVVLWVTDSEAAVGAWSQGRSSSLALNALLWATQRRCAKLGMYIVPRHVSRTVNTAADALSKQDQVPSRSCASARLTDRRIVATYESTFWTDWVEHWRGMTTKHSYLESTRLYA